MLRNLKLAGKLNLLLASIFILIIVLSGALLSVILQRNAEKIVTDKARLLIETMSSVRDYTSNQVNPELAPRLETEDQFLPQTVPAYSAREVFEYLRGREDYKSFLYKEATLNPTNLRDKADAFEAAVVEDFRSNANLKERTGFRSVPGGNIFYIARPLSVSKESCLRCHGAPSAAPKSQLATYGSQNGYDWKLNEIVGAQMIFVPANTIFSTARNLQVSVMAILAFFLLLAVILINFFLKTTITTPLKKMSQMAQRVSTGELEGEFKHPANDEIGVLANSFNRMKVSLEIAMQELTANMFKSDSKE